MPVSMPVSNTLNYYEILNCAPTSTKQQITTEYHILARSSHPDKVVDSLNNDKFVLVNKAYTILSDDHTRSLYDLWLSCGLNVSFEEWRTLNKDTAATMHWTAPVDPAKNAITHDAPANLRRKNSTPNSSCRPANAGFSPVVVRRGSLLHQFRTYQI